MAQHRFQKGQSGNPAGKPKGSKDKIKYDFSRICHDNKFNPCFELINLARHGSNDRIRLDATIELASYVAPKLKAIEFRGAEDTSGFSLTMNFSPQEQKNAENSDIQFDEDSDEVS